MSAAMAQLYGGRADGMVCAVQAELDGTPPLIIEMCEAAGSLWESTEIRKVRYRRWGVRKDGREWLYVHQDVQPPSDS